MSSLASGSRSRSVPREESPAPFHAMGGRKLELPVFSGDDAYSWIVHAERFFKLHSVADDEKLDVVVVALEDKALNWFQWWEEQVVRRD